jgi:preprotein translocase subunit SecA
VLEGRDVDQVIWTMVSEAIRDGVDKYITQDYVAANVAEWARENFDVVLDADDYRGYRRYEDIEPFIKDQARAEAQTTINATLAEFTGESTEDKTAWDTKGLQSWAMSRFQVQLSQAQIRQMDYGELEQKLRDSAIEQIERRDCAGIMKYLEPLYAEQALAAWVKDKFGNEVQISEHDFMASEKGGRGTRKTTEDIIDIIETKAREAYTKREIEYPVDRVLDELGGDGQGTPENPYAADLVRMWVHAKYGVEWPLAHVQNTPVRKLREEMLGYQRDWMTNGKIDKLADEIVAQNATNEQLAKTLNQRFGMALTPRDLEGRVLPGKSEAPLPDEDDDGRITTRDFVVRSVREFLRKELSDLEQVVLIRFLDVSWKDHLYAMDLLRNSIGLQAFAEQDPRVMYKKEGFRFFDEMMMGVREKVTDLIYKAKLRGPVQVENAYHVTSASHEDTGGYGVAENIRAVGAGDEAQQQQAAQAEGEGGGAVTKTIVREAEKVGRNDPCPCGSGKKYKKCCGVNAA